VIVPSERDVQDLARHITEAGASERARLFRLGRWSERVLDWAMSHPRFKTQLFRLIDVLPACRDDADVLRHLLEYFEGVDVPRVLGLELEVARLVPFGARISSVAVRRNVMRMARQLIAGARPDEALPRLASLWRAGEACTVDVLGEKTVTQDEAARYVERVDALLAALAAETSTWPFDERLERDPWGSLPRINVSIKPTALSPLFGPLTASRGLAEAHERLRPLLARAREVGAAIHLDMEHDDVKDLTLALLRAIGAEQPDGPQLGCVIQAYRKDAWADLQALVAWACDALRTPLAVRLVKGAYWDAETVAARAEGWPSPLFEAKVETDASYERCVRILVARAGSVRPAFGSHNVRSIAYAIATTRASGLPDTAIEHQLLYGRRNDAVRRAR
jgi:RHH-type proline utilization regulon transcriptional repressor/proline dehydrogenase/delta 1-pyrroline-5-carboxylate dehydrogenase